MPSGTVPENYGMQRQMQIYMAGLGGDRPDHPVSIEGWRAAARERLNDAAFDYLDGGAGTETTMQANISAFQRRRIAPRMLRGVDKRDLSVRVLGRTLPAPLMTAPIGVLGILHDGAETAVARAAASFGIPSVLSTVSSHTLEDVAAAAEDAPKWFQLYWGKDRDLTASLLKRAEAAGYSALVVTLDTTLLSWRERDIRNGYLPFLHGSGLANYFSDPAFRAKLDDPPEENPAQAILHFAQNFSDASLTWDDLLYLREHTRLPIVLKGILRVDDARRALDHGADGLIVSNHGGRQMDGAVAALDVLPAISDAVGKEMDVLFDSGVRSGADILKAVALGARAVLIGRPYAYGLAVGGESGVRDVLGNLLADLDLSMGLAGCRSFAEVDPDLLASTNG